MNFIIIIIIIIKIYSQLFSCKMMALEPPTRIGAFLF